MKTDLHPTYVDSQVTCTCGNSFTTRSTEAAINVEICSNCHPFYTGKQKLMDTGGRVERFRRRAAAAAAKQGATPTGGAPAAADEAPADEAPAADAPAAE
jgi:large subunit ribosomal protein L31